MTLRNHPVYVGVALLTSNVSPAIPSFRDDLLWYSVGLALLFGGVSLLVAGTLLERQAETIRAELRELRKKLEEDSKKPEAQPNRAVYFSPVNPVNVREE